jgi:hypothetical protein
LGPIIQDHKVQHLLVTWARLKSSFLFQIWLLPQSSAFISNLGQIEKFFSISDLTPATKFNHLLVTWARLKSYFLSQIWLLPQSSTFISNLGHIEKLFSISDLILSVKPLELISTFEPIRMLDLGWTLALISSVRGA